METIKMGDVTIDRIVDNETIYFKAPLIYQNLTEEILKKHLPTMNEMLIHPVTLDIGLSFHSFLIRTRGKNILVDTCNGTHKQRPDFMPWQHMQESEAYLYNLAKFGLSPDDIDYVLCTHLHSDHVGMEYQAREWPLGADLQKCQIRDGKNGI